MKRGLFYSRICIIRAVFLEGVYYNGCHLWVESFEGVSYTGCLLKGYIPPIISPDFVLIET